MSGKKINFSDRYLLSADNIKYIKENPTIEEITTKSYNAFSKDIYANEKTVCITYPINVCNYDGLIISSAFDDKRTYKDTSLNIIVNSYDDMERTKQTYEYIESRINGVQTVTLLDKIGYEKGETYKNEVRLEISENKEISKLTIPSNNIKAIINLVNNLERSAPIKKINIHCDNQTHEDMHYLKALDRKYDLKIDYGSCMETTYEEYQNMRSTIDWYKELISDSQLSPIEKVAYAYDILKTFKYTEDQEDLNRSRYIPAIVTDGKIVCVGYSNFLKQLLAEIDIKAETIGVSTLDKNGAEVGHERNLIRVDDDKYNIHGIYVFDATWDSVKEELSIVNDNGKHIVTDKPEEREILEKFNALSLYRYFLVPLSEYEQRYPEDSLPHIYKSYKNNNLEEILDYSAKRREGEFPKITSNIDLITQDEIKSLFEPDEGVLTIKKYIEAKRPTLETFKEIITNVRKHEGYSPEAIRDDIEKNIEMHNMLSEQNGPSEIFFESKSK